MSSRVIVDISALNNVRVPLQMSHQLGFQPAVLIGICCFTPELPELLDSGRRRNTQNCQCCTNLGPLSYMMNSVIGYDWFRYEHTDFLVIMSERVSRSSLCLLLIQFDFHFYLVCLIGMTNNITFALPKNIPSLLFSPFLPSLSILLPDTHLYVLQMQNQSLNSRLSQILSFSSQKECGYYYVIYFPS